MICVCAGVINAAAGKRETEWMVRVALVQTPVPGLMVKVPVVLAVMGFRF